MKRFFVLVIIVMLSIPLSVLGQRRIPAIAKQVILTGILSTNIVEREGASESWYTLRTNQGSYKLQTTQDLDNLSEQEITVTGQIRGQSLVVQREVRIKQGPRVPLKDLPQGVSFVVADEKEFVEFSENFMNLPPPTHTERPIYIIPINFTNDTSEPMSSAHLTQLMFGNEWISPTVKGMLRDTSSGHFNITGEVHPSWVTIPFTNADCTNNMLNNWSNNAWTQVTQAGVNLNNYGSVIHVFPNIPNCNIGPVANQLPKGDLNSKGQVWFPLYPLVVEQFVRIMAHEIGHNLGQTHSQAIAHSGAIFVNDRACYMGSGLTQANVYQKLMMGWLRGKVVTINSPGTYTFNIFPPDEMVKKNKTIIIQVRDSSGNVSPYFLILEVRRSLLPYNDLRSAAGYLDALIIRKAHRDMTQNTSQSYVIDTTETSTTEDAPLKRGLTHTIAEFGVTIRYTTKSKMLGSQIDITQTY